MFSNLLLDKILKLANDTFHKKRVNWDYSVLGNQIYFAIGENFIKQALFKIISMLPICEKESQIQDLETKLWM